MKTSTAFACQIPINDYDLHLLMSLIIEQEEEFAKDYGMQKIYSKTLNDYVGIGGLIRNENNILEVGTLLKAKYIGSGIGVLVTNKIADNFEEIGNVMIAVIWEENIPSIKLVKKNNMIFMNKINKSYGDKTIIVETYIKFSSKMKLATTIKIEDYLTINKTI